MMKVSSALAFLLLYAVVQRSSASVLKRMRRVTYEVDGHDLDNTDKKQPGFAVISSHQKKGRSLLTGEGGGSHRSGKKKGKKGKKKKRHSDYEELMGYFMRDASLSTSVGYPSPSRPSKPSPNQPPSPSPPGFLNNPSPTTPDSNPGTAPTLEPTKLLGVQTPQPAPSPNSNTEPGTPEGPQPGGGTPATDAPSPSGVGVVTTAPITPGSGTLTPAPNGQDPGTPSAPTPPNGGMVTTSPSGPSGTATPTNPNAAPTPTPAMPSTTLAPTTVLAVVTPAPGTPSAPAADPTDGSPNGMNPAPSLTSGVTNAPNTTPDSGTPAPTNELGESSVIRDVEILEKCGITASERSSNILALLTTVSNPWALVTTSSIVYQARQWTDEQDGMIICPVDSSAFLQRYAVAVVYFALNGPNWDVCGASSTTCAGSTRWLDSSSECDWFGLSCNGAGVLDTMVLKANGLNGNLPHELMTLTSLTQLSLDHNDISGAIPADISLLADLEILELDSNQMTGNMPGGLFLMTSLQALDLNDNTFTGILAPQIANLNSLMVLQLENNELNGAVPAQSLVQLPNLSKLEHLRSTNRARTHPPTHTGLTLSL